MRQKKINFTWEILALIITISIVSYVLFNLPSLAHAQNATVCPSGDATMCFQCDGTETSWSCCPADTETGFICEPNCNSPEIIDCPDAEDKECLSALAKYKRAFAQAAVRFWHMLNGE